MNRDIYEFIYHIMVGFHPINRTMIVGTFMLIGSNDNNRTGSFVSLTTLLCFSLPFILLLWSENILPFRDKILFIGTLLAAKSGKLQKNAGDIWNNKKGSNDLWLFAGVNFKV